MAGLTLKALADLVQGEYLGDPELVILGVAPPDQAKPNDLVFLLDQRWRETVQNSRSQAVLLGCEEAGLIENKAQIIVTQVRSALARILAFFHPSILPEPGIHSTAILDPSAELAEGVSIGPYCVLGKNCRIGSGSVLEAHVVLGDNVQMGRACHIYPQVTLYADVHLGNAVIIHSGTRIGSDGYGFYLDQGQHVKIPQVGGVRIGDRVEIGANVTIDRGTVGQTEVGAGTKIDNLVQIGHNVKIGDNSLLVAQVGISGSTHLGQNVTLAGQVGVAGHLQIGDGVIAAGKTGITKDIPAGLKVSGFPAQDHRQELRLQAAMRKLPELLRWWQQSKKSLD